MLDNLTTESRHPDSENIDALSTAELVQLINREDHTVPAAVATQLAQLATAVDAVVESFRRGGRLVYIGAGTSGRLGVLDASECPPTFNTPPEMVVGLIAGGDTALRRAIEGAEDHPEFATRDLEQIQLSERDTLVGIATSGRTPYVLGGLSYARKLGCTTIGLSCNPSSELEPLCDICIVPVVGPELISGSTRLKAGTATKLVLNTLTTAAMVRIGKTFGNLMVDLKATNQKLLLRTNRIVQQLTGLSPADSAALLERCDGELKTAVVVELARVTPAEARQRLATAAGHLRTALTPGG